MVAHQAVVLQSWVRTRRLPSPQLTANLLVGYHLGKALGCGLTSVRGNRGKNYENEPLNYENEPLVPQKHTKEKKVFSGQAAQFFLVFCSLIIFNLIFMASLLSLVPKDSFT
jgi:hypothetical protein